MEEEKDSISLTSEMLKANTKPKKMEVNNSFVQLPEKMKTLKEIAEPSRFVHVDELRAEAIKWCKHFKQYVEFEALQWFMDFFNLTEEDLE